MNNLVLYITGGSDEITITSLIALFVFLSVLECISSVIRSALKLGGF